MSAFHFANRKGGWQFHSVMQPKSKFLGNSAASIMDGHGVLEVLALWEEYEFTFPSYYVRGLLIGVMRMEISGDVNITCKKTGLSCALTFSNKGFFKGENNSVSGKVVRSSDKTELCKVSGRWDKVCMYVCMDGLVNVGGFRSSSCVCGTGGGVGWLRAWVWHRDLLVGIRDRGVYR